MEMLKSLFDTYTVTDIYSKSIIVKAMDNERRVAAKKIESVLGTDTYLEVDDLIGETEVASERYGFIQGFEFAKKLLLS